MDVRTGELTVMVERQEPGPVTVRLVPIRAANQPASREGEVVTESRDSLALHEVTVRGLRPATAYRYEVRGPGLSPFEARVATAPEAQPFVPTRFIVYGDTRSRAAQHRAIVQAIVARAPDWVLHTGDLLDDGRDERQWQSFFEIEAPLLDHTPWLAVVGNHELVRPSSTGLDHFRRYVHCEPSSPSPEIDTTFSWANVFVVAVNAYDDFSDVTKMQWLERALAQARHDADESHGWLLFASHWGPRSSGPHGDNRPFRRVNMDAVLRRHRVDLVISGHDHAYERGDDQGLRYLVSGGGGAPLYRQRHDNAHSRIYERAYHFVQIDVTHERLVITAIRPDGSALDRCGLRHDTGWDCDPPPWQRPHTVPGPDGGTSVEVFASNSQGNCRCSAVSRAGPTRAWLGVLVTLVGLLMGLRKSRTGTRDVVYRSPR